MKIKINKIILETNKKKFIKKIKIIIKKFQ